jgi:glycosyltransferase involved in cell wall biosynthesis
VADRAPPTISVLTPVYNGEKYLAECIESALAQTRGDWEHLIVDNHSQDRTAEIAERYAAQDERIKVIRCDEFVSVHRNFSRSVRLVHPDSRFCKFICADDWIYPECLERMVALAEKHPEVGVVSSYKLEGLQLGNGGIVPYNQEVMPGKEVVRRTLLTGCNLTGSPTQLLYRAELLRRSQPFFDETVWHTDTHAALRTLLTCDLGFVHQVLTFTRLHPGALTSTAEHLNTHLAYEVRQLVQFGRDVLSETEYRSAIRSALHKYWWFLAKQNLKPWRLREVKFHSYHRTEISRMLAELKSDRESEIFLKRLQRWLRDVPAGDGPATKAEAGERVLPHSSRRSGAAPSS